MRYRADLPPVLKALDFEATPAQKIGIVGRTGAGERLLLHCPHMPLCSTGLLHTLRSAMIAVLPMFRSLTFA
jgi:ATPase subunit of ABC transporter with duplicated ATPase domains